jgi:hypothetical protein
VDVLVKFALNIAVQSIAETWLGGPDAMASVETDIKGGLETALVQLPQ